MTKRKNIDLELDTEDSDVSSESELELLEIVDNRVYLDGSISNEKIDKVILKLTKIHEKMMILERRLGINIPIILEINTDGGEVFPALKLYDFIKKNKIQTHISGFCASAGMVIAMGGEKRTISKNSVWLIHEVRSGTSGKVKKLKEDLSNIEKTNNRLKEIFLQKINISSKELDELFESDIEHYPEEALRLGIVDEII